MGRIVLQAFFTEITAEIAFCQENMKVTNYRTSLRERSMALAKNVRPFLIVNRQ